MPLQPEQKLIVDQFLQRADFNSGSVILDLDGTALFEDKGKVFISGSVGSAIGELWELKKPVVLNTLRFPLSVIDTVAREWISITNERIPAVLLNGSLLGFIEAKEEQIIWREVAAFPMQRYEIEEMVDGIFELLKNDIRDIVLFYYPRNWKKGEIIWVPDEHRIAPLLEKYVSANSVITGPLPELLERMINDDACMALVLVDRPRDTLMAYQHNDPNTFFTHHGVDKSSGLKEMADVLGISLEDSVGAGDTTLDNFLKDVGLAIIVGGDDIPYTGAKGTIKVKDPIELGELIASLATEVRSRFKDKHEDK